MLKRIVIAGLLTIWATAPGARELDINIQDEAAEIGYFVPPPGDTEVDDTRLGGSVFFNTDDDLVLSGVAHVQGPPAEGFSPLQFGAGAKAYGAYVSEPSSMVAAIGLSGSSRLTIPAQIPQALVLKAHVAPKITAFGDLDRVFEGVVRYKLEFTPRATAYLGYRYKRFYMDDNSDQTLDDRAHLGIRIAF